jgi:putative ABC transport system permease protein
VALRRVVARLRGLFRRDIVTDEIREELDFHLRQRTDQYAREGLTPGEAAARARQRVGNLALHLDRGYDIRGGGIMDTVRQEVIWAWRGLRGAPGTTLLAMAILTLGIAAATVTFSVVDAVALRRLPFDAPDRLVAIARVDRASEGLAPVAPQDFFTWQDQAGAFEGLAATGPWGLSYTPEGGAPQRLITQRVTSNLFDVLRVAPASGRGFTTAHEVTGGDDVVILSHAAWQNRFGGDPEIVGKRVTFGKEMREIIAIMPPGFTYPIGPANPTEAYVPHVPRAADRDHAAPGRSYYLRVVGRLRPEATLAQAEEQVKTATAAVVAAHPKQTYWKDARPAVLPLHDYMVGPAKRWLLLVLGAVVLVLAISYVNVANLLLARATARSREFAVRTALGASRSRVARTLTLESLMLSLAAAAAGILLAGWGVSIATASLPPGLARASTIAINLRVLMAAVGAAVVTGLVFGTIPALVGARPDIMSVIKQGGSALGAGRIRTRWQRALLVSELAFVVTLLVPAALFVTSFINVTRADLGFSRDRLVGFEMSRTLTATEPDQRRPSAEAFVSEAVARARAVPGVEDAAFIDGGLPLFGMVATYGIKIDGHPPITGADQLALKEVTPNYFRVAGIRLVHGRIFDAASAGAPAVAIINEEAARRFFPGRNPVGAVIRFRAPTTIVGVVSSVRMSGPEVELRPELYLPLHQHDMGGESILGDVIVRLGPGGSAQAVQAALQGMTGTGRAPEISDLEERFRQLTAHRRFNAALMTAFGVLALVIAAAGVYGLMSFVVGQQTRSIGLRLAIGATAGHIFRSVLAQSGRLMLLGVGGGLVGAWAASRLFTSVVFGITGNEPWLYAVVALALAATALLAAIVPAWRASRVDPLVALRND